jgi:antitoxin MazE
MLKRLTRTGNSWALVIDRALLRRLGVDGAAPLEVTADDDAIVLTPVRRGARAGRGVDAVAEVGRRYRAGRALAPAGPRRIGLRELKGRLGEHVRRVRAGETILITARGEVVAELAPPGAASSHAEDGLVMLARRGLLTLGGRNRPEMYPSMPRTGKPGLAKQLLDEIRGEQ